MAHLGCHDHLIMVHDRKLEFVIPGRDCDRKLEMVISGRDRESCKPAMSHDGLRNQTGLTAIWPCPK